MIKIHLICATGNEGKFVFKIFNKLFIHAYIHLYSAILYIGDLWFTLIIHTIDLPVFMQFSALNSVNDDNFLKIYLLYGFRPGESESAIRFAKLLTVFPQNEK